MAKLQSVRSRVATGVATVLLIGACTVNQDRGADERRGQDGSADPDKGEHQAVTPVQPSSTAGGGVPTPGSERAPGPRPPEAPGVTVVQQAGTKLVSPQTLPAPRSEVTTRSATGSAPGSERTLVRYVRGDRVNVRAEPSLTGKVVRRLSRGSTIHGSAQGEWTQIGEGQYVQSRFLSSQKPRAPKRHGKHLAKH